jgi:hypothetical protein
VFLHERIGNLAVFAERAGRTDLVETHEAGVSCRVGSDYGGEPAPDAVWVLTFDQFGIPTLERAL